MSRPACRAGVRYTYEEYLTAERGSNVRHEFLAGEIFLMAGATPEHEELAASVLVAFRTQLEGSDCRAFGSNLRVRVRERDLITYPDVSVVCGTLERDDGTPPAILNPAVLVEVTSDSTEAYDRGDKFEHYRCLPSLEAMVFVSHREPRIDVCTRAGSGRGWTDETALAGARVRVPPCGIELDVDGLYAGWQALHGRPGTR